VGSAGGAGFSYAGDVASSMRRTSRFAMSNSWAGHTEE
jgi:hypothetical protein